MTDNMTATIHASRYKEWSKHYNWSTCITNREEYGRFLISILTSEKDGFVLNLNGSWGTGKTEFLRRLYVELAEQSYPVVYIDAWESDFLKDPLTVVCTELLNQLGYLFKHAKVDKRTSLYRSCVESVNDLLLNFNKLSTIAHAAGKTYSALSGEDVDTTHLGLLEAIIGSGININKLQGVNDVNESILSDLMGQQRDINDSMEAIRKQIGVISYILSDLYNLKIPIVVLVDELDRCRPDYAIKMLEIIKHFFDVKGCAFLIATDTKSLQASIKSVYGSEFEASRYLKRFFSQQITLQKPSILEYIQAKKINFHKYELLGLEVFPFSEDIDLNNKMICNLLDFDSIELRDIEQILRRLVSCLDYIATEKPKSITLINLPVLLLGIVEHHCELESFYARTNEQIGSYHSASGEVIDDIPLSDFIYFNLSLVTVTHSMKRYEKNMVSNFGSYNEMLTIHSYSQDRYQTTAWHNNNAQLLNKANNIAKQFINGADGIWLWEDYKNMISLAAHIK